MINHKPPDRVPAVQRVGFLFDQPQTAEPGASGSALGAPPQTVHVRTARRRNNALDRWRSVSPSIPFDAFDFGGNDGAGLTFYDLFDVFQRTNHGTLAGQAGKFAGGFNFGSH